MAMQRIFLTIILLLNCLAAYSIKGQNNVPVMSYANGTLRSPTNFFRTNVTAGVGITFSFGNTNGQLTINSSFNSPQLYGAKGDGVTDDTAAFQAALNIRGLVYVPWTTNGYVVSSLIITNDTQLTGIGGRPKLIFNWSATGYMLDCRSNLNISLNNLELDGQSNITFQAISAAGSRSAIKLYSFGNYSVVDCNIHGFDNQGIFVTAPFASSSTGVVLSNNNTSISLGKINYCYTGIEYDDSSAEYQQAVGLAVRQCANGIKINSGNITISSSILAMNGNGVYLSGTNNNSHGNFNSCILNHNTYPIYATNCINGFNFIGNQIWQGNVVLHTCRGIRIIGGNLDVDTINVTNGGYNLIAENMAGGTYNNTLNVSGGNTTFLDNRYNLGALLWGPSLYSEATNILSLRDFANGIPMEWRVYNNSSTEWAGMKWSANIGLIGTQKTGGGTARDFGLYTDNTVRWRVDASTGDLRPFLNTTYSIGSASLMPSNIFTSKLWVNNYFTNTGPSDFGGAVTNWLTVRNAGNVTNDAILHQSGNLVLNLLGASKLVVTDASKNISNPAASSGQIPIGTAAGAYTMATITPGGGIVIGNGSGSITLSWDNTNKTIWNLASSAATVPLTINSSRSDQSADLLDFVVNSATLASVSAKGASKFLVFALNETGNNTLLTTDVGSWINNSGASGAVTNTLPAATLGYQFGLTVIAAQICTFKAVGSDTIRNAGSVSAAAGGITANTIGSHIHIYCPVAGQWIADSVVGSWTTF